MSAPCPCQDPLIASHLKHANAFVEMFKLQTAVATLGKDGVPSFLPDDDRWKWYAGVLRDFWGEGFPKDNYDACVRSLEGEDKDSKTDARKRIVQAHKDAWEFSKTIAKTLITDWANMFPHVAEALGVRAEPRETSEASTAGTSTQTQGTMNTGPGTRAGSRAFTRSSLGSLPSIAEVLSKNDKTATEPGSDMSAGPSSTGTGTA
jgi:hypothetical protein